MASLSGAAARSTTAGGHAAAVQRCFVPRLPHRGITAQAASGASGPLRKAAQRSDSSVRSPVAVASSNKGSQAAREAGPAPAVQAAQKAPFRRLAALPLVLLLACWLLPLQTTQPWPAVWAVRLAVVAVVAVVFVALSFLNKMIDSIDQQRVELLLHDKPPAALTAELARKFRCLKQSAEFTVLLILVMGVAVTAFLFVADVIRRALLGEGLAHLLLQPAFTLSYPPAPEQSVPLWFVVAFPFLVTVTRAVDAAWDARRLFWAAAAARRQANAARLAAKRSGAQQPSMQP